MLRDEAVKAAQNQRRMAPLVLGVRHERYRASLRPPSSGKLLPPKRSFITTQPHALREHSEANIMPLTGGRIALTAGITMDALYF